MCWCDGKCSSCFVLLIRNSAGPLPCPAAPFTGLQMDRQMLFSFNYFFWWLKGRSFLDSLSA